jgi:hypothetical protein
LTPVASSCSSAVRAGSRQRTGTSCSRIQEADPRPTTGSAKPSHPRKAQRQPSSPAFPGPLAAVEGPPVVPGMIQMRPEWRHTPRRCASQELIRMPRVPWPRTMIARIRRHSPRFGPIDARELVLPGRPCGGLTGFSPCATPLMGDASHARGRWFEPISARRWRLAEGTSV